MDEINFYFNNIYRYMVKKEIINLIYQRKKDTSHKIILSENVIIISNDYDLLINTLFDFTCDNKCNDNYLVYLKLIINRAIGIAMENNSFIVTYDEILKAIMPLKYVIGKDKAQELSLKYQNDYQNNFKQLLKKDFH